MIKSHGSEPVSLRGAICENPCIFLIIYLIENSWCKIIIWCSNEILTVYVLFTLIRYRFRLAYYFFTGNLVIFLCIATYISEITIANSALREKEIWYMTIIPANRVRFSFFFLSFSCASTNAPLNLVIHSNMGYKSWC